MRKRKLTVIEKKIDRLSVKFNTGENSDFWKILFAILT